MRSLLLLGVVALMSCRVGDPFAPTVANMAGAYTAHALVIADTAGAIDWIDAGGSLTLTLSANGSLSGRLFLPGGAAGGGDLDEDMAGNWFLIGHTISFGQAAQTFVRDMDFTADQDRISVDHYFGTTLRVIIVLTK
jgi:hypothetical protein